MGAWITNILDGMGYAGVAWLAFLENVFPPIPSELIMPLGGYLASQGTMTLAGVIAAGTLGSVLGALLLYAVGWWFGERSEERRVGNECGARAGGGGEMVGGG